MIQAYKHNLGEYLPHQHERLNNQIRRPKVTLPFPLMSRESIDLRDGSLTSTGLGLKLEDGVT